jgi:hypothetical protein
MGIPLSPFMDWSDVPSGLSYRLQIATDIIFNNVVFDSAGIPASSINIPSGKLNGNTIYHWRVNTSNGSGAGNWSAIWTFTTAGQIGIPVLVSPPNNATIGTITTTLIWNIIPSASNYYVQLSLDSLFQTYIISDSTLTQNYYFIPAGLLSNLTRYYWRVNAKNSNGWGGFSSVWTFRIELVTKLSNYKNGTPDEYKLYDNFPNPFNPATKIRFDLPKSSNTKITIYDINGREISQLINGVLKAGYYEISWNAGWLSSGVYIYRFESDKFMCAKKMLLIK